MGAWSNILSAVSPGISSQLDIYSGLGYDVAIMSNYDPPAAMHVAGKLRSLICRK
jgi:hypothetical protein